MKGIQVKMKRTLIILLLAVIYISVFCSCSSSGSPETSMEVQPTPIPGSPMTQDDLTFNIRGVKLEGNEDAGKYVEKLGNDYEFNESPSCNFVGNDRMYIYSDFYIAAYPNNGKFLVLDVTITADTLSTLRGAKVGMKPEEITVLYGEDYIEVGSLMQYVVDGDPEDANNASLSFAIDTDTRTVDYITISAKIKDE